VGAEGAGEGNYDWAVPYIAIQYTMVYKYIKGIIRCEKEGFVMFLYVVS
jgi:hypothetical protein